MNPRTMGVVGLGYVGLPLAIELCRSGYQVIGVDTDRARVSALQKGESYIGDIASADLAALVGSGGLRVTTDFSPLSAVEGISICVPTPLRKTRDPDVSYVASAAESISEVLRPGQTVILESTVYPGATEELVAPILERSGLKAGRDFYLAFSPERIDPGNGHYHLRDIPKLVGGVDEISTRKAVELYSAVFHTVMPMASAKEAEMAKLLENTFRAVNIGLANEMAIIARQMGINFWRVVEAAATKPFGFMPFYPGPGWGGHCIPVDPVYLSWRVKIDGQEAGFIDHAVRINSRMPWYVVERVADLLNQRGKPLCGSRVLVLGVTYKRDVADTRESPALTILELLEQKMVSITYHDPYVPRLELNGLAWESQPLTAEMLARQDCVIVAADHSSFDYEFVARHAALVFDTRNATRGIRERYPHVQVL